MGFQRTDCNIVPAVFVVVFFQTILKGKENNSERQGRLSIQTLLDCGDGHPGRVKVQR